MRRAAEPREQVLEELPEEEQAVQAPAGVLRDCWG